MAKSTMNRLKRQIIMWVQTARDREADVDGTGGRYLYKEDGRAVGVPTRTALMKKTIEEMTEDDHFYVNDRAEDGSMVWVLPIAPEEDDVEEATSTSTQEVAPMAAKKKASKKKATAKAAASESNDDGEGEEEVAEERFCLSGSGNTVFGKKALFAQGGDAKLGSQMKRSLSGKLEPGDAGFENCTSPEILGHERLKQSPKFGPLIEEIKKKKLHTKRMGEVIEPEKW